MHNMLFWEVFAERTINQLVRPQPGDPVLILTSTVNDISLAEACFAAALRAGADAQLIVKPPRQRGTAEKLGPILSDAIRASKLVLDLCDEIDTDPATLEARDRGARFLVTNVRGIEDYVLRALLDIDYEEMIHNAEIVAQLWDQTKHCQVTSPQGTDVSFELAPRQSLVGDGALTEDGEIDFFPGAQVSIAPVEETINGRIVVDASDSVQGIVHADYSLTLKDGVITKIEGQREAEVMRSWLTTRRDDTVYRLCHFTIGLNPQASISGNMTEDERVLAAIDFGFGHQNSDFGGTVGLSLHHMDVMLAAPTVYLDGKVMSGNGRLNSEMGFKEV